MSRQWTSWVCPWTETTISSSPGEGSFNSGANSVQETETYGVTVRVTDTNSEQEGVANLKGRTEAKYPA